MTRTRKFCHRCHQTPSLYEKGLRQIIVKHLAVVIFQASEKKCFRERKRGAEALSTA